MVGRLMVSHVALGHEIEREDLAIDALIKIARSPTRHQSDGYANGREHWMMLVRMRVNLLAIFLNSLIHGGSHFLHVFGLPFHGKKRLIALYDWVRVPLHQHRIT